MREGTSTKTGGDRREEKKGREGGKRGMVQERRRPQKRSKFLHSAPVYWGVIHQGP